MHVNAGVHMSEYEWGVSEDNICHSVHWEWSEDNTCHRVHMGGGRVIGQPWCWYLSCTLFKTWSLLFDSECTRLSGSRSSGGFPDSPSHLTIGVLHCRCTPPHTAWQGSGEWSSGLHVWAASPPPMESFPRPSPCSSTTACPGPSTSFLLRNVVDWVDGDRAFQRKEEEEAALRSHFWKILL